MNVEQLSGVPGARGSLAHLARPDGQKMLFARKLFANKRSNLQVYEGAGERVVVKRVGQSARIREEHAAIGLLARHPRVVGFVPTTALQTRSGRFFNHAGNAYFCMPQLGTDMLDYRRDHADDVPFYVWAETVVSVLSTVAACLLNLWRETQSSYYDVKARNILAVRNLVELEPPFSHHEILVCDTGSINSACATHHPPLTLTQHAPPGSRARYRQYIGWGMICTLVELMEGPEKPRALREMRNMTTKDPIHALDAAIDQVLESIEHHPETYVRVLTLVQIARAGVESGSVDQLLVGLAAC